MFENYYGFLVDVLIVVVCYGFIGGSYESYVRNIFVWVMKFKEDGGLGGRGVVVNVSWFYIIYVYVWLIKRFIVLRMFVVFFLYVKVEKLISLNYRCWCFCNFVLIVFCRYYNGFCFCFLFYL